MDNFGNSKVHVSIIMPMFNAGRFLRQTLQYVADQTYGDYELICIDDCSDDSTADIVKEYMQKDQRIRYYRNEERSGAAFSRNRGIDISVGEYLAFWDSDDYFDPELLKLFLETAEKYNTDVVIYDYIHVKCDSTGNIVNVDHPETYLDRLCRKGNLLSDLDDMDSLFMPISPCNKIYRRDFLSEQKISFQTLSSSNDLYFSEMVALSADKIIFLNTGRYMLHARDHDTPSRISFNRDPMCAFLALEQVMKDLIERQLMCKRYKYYFIRLYPILSNAVLRTNSDKVKEDFYSFLKEEGIRKLIEPCKEFFEKMDDYTRELILSFVNEEYHSNWFKATYDIHYYFEIRKEVLKKWVSARHKEGKKIALWGIGLRGSCVAEKIYENGIDLDYLFDMNPEFRGTFIGNLEISDPSSSIDETDIVLFTSGKILEENRYELHKKGKKCVYLMEI